MLFLDFEKNVPGLSNVHVFSEKDPKKLKDFRKNSKKIFGTFSANFKHFFFFLIENFSFKHYVSEINDDKVPEKNYTFS